MRDWRAETRRRLAGLELEPARAEEIVEELAQHLEDRQAELLARGASAAEIDRVLRAELSAGGVLQRELDRVERPAKAAPPLGAPSGRLLAGIRDDVRYGLRSLRRGRGMTLAALVTLSLGIGATTAVFSIVDAVLLRPLPFVEPHRLVSFWGSAPEMGLPVVNYPDGLYSYFRARSRTLQDVTAYSVDSLTLTGAGEPERVKAASVTVDFFRLLGVNPALGRVFRPEEERESLAVISHAFWQRRFGGERDVVGRALVLEGQPARIVGVMPPGFEFPASGGATELWFPKAIDAQNLNCWCWSTLGRLAPGRTPGDAAREIARLSDDFWREREHKPTLPASEDGKAVVFAVPLAHTLVGEVETPLLVLLGAVVLVLLIACANLANLLLARATARAREIAMRCCLGASPWRVARQLFVESLLLAGAGALSGLALAYFALRALAPLVLTRVPHLQSLGLHPKAAALTLALAFATALHVGLAPALRAARTDVHEAVKEGARGSGGPRSQRLSRAFVVAQLALSLVLLVGAGLLLRSFRNLMEVDLGFRPEGVLVGRIALPSAPPPDAARERQFYGQLAERVAALPGVRGVGLASIAPFSDGDNGQIFTIRGREPRPDQPNLVARFRVTTPGYFAAVGTPLLRGRAFDAGDTEGSPGVAIVDDVLARRFWPDGNALGHEIRLGDAKSTRPWREIVGVVADVKHGNVTEDASRHVYAPLAQQDAGSMDLVVRSAADPTALAAAVRREVASLDPAVPVYQVHTLDAAVAQSLATRRLTERLLEGFALAALLLASVGVYGVMALDVSRRVSEFGIRLALGAAPADVLRLVLRRGVGLVIAGLSIGLGGALLLGRVIAALLFQVKPVDPLTLSGVALILAACALAACYLAARRATATDPLTALRSE